MWPIARQQGFTLMEALIAVAITAVIGLGVWQVLSGVITTRERVDNAASEFAALQRAMLLVERDIQQLVDRPARDIYGDVHPALTSRISPFKLLLTRQGWRNPLGERRSGLQRVGWHYDGDRLQRLYWPAVDQGQNDNRRQVPVLDNVRVFQLRFLDSNRQWREDWPVQDARPGVDHGSQLPALPLGLELTLEHARFGTLKRVFALPDFDAGKAQASLNRNTADSSAEPRPAQAEGNL